MRSKTLQVPIKDILKEKVKSIETYLGVSAAEVARRGIEMMYKEMMREKFGYKGYMRKPQEEKETKKDIQNKIRAMNSVELYEYLNELGYFAIEDGVENTIEESPALGLVWVQTRGGMRREIFTVEEIIKDLTKKSLI